MFKDNYIVISFNFICIYFEYDWNVLVCVFDILYMFLFYIYGVLYIKLYVFKINSNIFCY